MRIEAPTAGEIELLAKSHPNDKSKATTDRGLKELSRSLCEKLVKNGSVTTDEITRHLAGFTGDENQSDEQDRFCMGTRSQYVLEKSVRRRMYDFVNVLLALGVVRKTGTVIDWLGASALQKNTMKRLENLSATDHAYIQQRAKLRQHIREVRDQVAEKQKEYDNLRSFKRVLKRVRRRNAKKYKKENGCKAPSKRCDEDLLMDESLENSKRLHFPFAVIKLHRGNSVDSVCIESDFISSVSIITIDDSFQLFSDVSTIAAASNIRDNS